jgi:hypothetical protein
MCKKAFLFFVGIATYSIDGFEKSINATEKTINKGRHKLSMCKNISQDTISNTKSGNE